MKYGAKISDSRPQTNATPIVSPATPITATHAAHRHRSFPVPSAEAAASKTRKPAITPMTIGPAISSASERVLSGSEMCADVAHAAIPTNCSASKTAIPGFRTTDRAVKDEESPTTTSMTTPTRPLRLTRRDVVGGVEVEEAAGLEREADVGGGHDGVVFGAGEVRMAHRVPE